MALRRIFPLVAVLLFAANGCLSQKPTAKDSLCSKEMCVFLFDRLEEQSIRLHNIEDALMRTVSILASVKDQEFSTASAALKSDPLLNSLFTADAYGPVESNLLRSNQMTNSLQSPVKSKYSFFSIPTTKCSCLGLVLMCHWKSSQEKAADWRTFVYTERKTERSSETVQGIITIHQPQRFFFLPIIYVTTKNYCIYRKALPHFKCGVINQRN